MSVIPPLGTISFARGVPPPDVFPVGELAECARAVLEREGETVLNYGGPAGYEPLRAWIAVRHGVPPGRVLVTPGSLVGLNLLARAVVGRGASAVVEAPTYDRMLRILGALGADVRSVPRREDGLDLDALRALLDKGPRPSLLYAMPTFHNPTGRTLSVAQRRELVEIAGDNGVLVFEDDPYGLVRFEGVAPPSLLELARTSGRDDWVVFSSSFSKTVAPGLRVGYLIVPERLVPVLERLALDLYVSPPIVPQAQLFEFLRRGLFEPNLERVRACLRARHDAMLEALAAEVAPGAAWSRPGGGYFLWLELSGDLDAGALLARARERGVSFVPGCDFFPNGGGESAARLAFSFPSPDEIREGIRRLGALVRDALSAA